VIARAPHEGGGNRGGTAILAADFGDELGVDSETRERAEGFLEEISVVPDARIVREYATAMHDPTEGGVASGLLEVARASNVRLEVDRDAVPIREETAARCARRPASTRYGSSAPALVVATVLRTHWRTVSRVSRMQESRPPRSGPCRASRAVNPNSFSTVTRSPSRSRTISIRCGRPPTRTTDPRPRWSRTARRRSPRSARFRGRPRRPPRFVRWTRVPHHP